MSPEWHDADVAAATSSPPAWLPSNFASGSSATVGSLVPPDFQRYARVLYPVRRKGAVGRAPTVTWSDVARVSGALAHPGMQWDTITATAPAERVIWASRPHGIPHLVVEAMAEVLSAHTTTLHECWFGFWEGNTALESTARVATPVPIGGYRYFLARGPVSAAVRSLHGLRPHIWWPVDKSWCIATHSDFDSAYFGASAACVDALVTSPDLETWEVDVDSAITADSDTLNSLGEHG